MIDEFFSSKFQKPIFFRWSDQGAFTGDMHSIVVKFYSQVNIKPIKIHSINSNFAAY